METLFVIMGHRTIRKFKDKPIPEADVILMLEAGLRAPTSGLTMPYSIIRVDDMRLKNVLYEVSGYQKQVIEAPLTLLFLVDGNRNIRIIKSLGKRPLRNGLALFVNGVINASIAAQNIVIMAEAMGYGTCYIGAIQNDPIRIIREFSLPKFTFPIFALVIGYPDENPKLKPRLPLNIMIHSNEYLEFNDDRLREGVNFMERQLPWLDIISKYFAENGRFDVRSGIILKALEMQGFI